MAKILIADDNADNVYSLKLIMELMGNEVCTALDGLAAFITAQEFKPDVILLDIQMPKLNGHQVCEHIKEKEWSQGMIIVAVSGFTYPDKIKNFDFSLIKPIDFIELQNKLMAFNIDINLEKIKL